jgi:mRNA interferase RelE/StbE
MEDAEMLADVKAYDAAKARLEDGEDELIPLEITERRLRGEPALRVWREHRELTQELPVFAADTRTQSQPARKER